MMAWLYDMVTEDEHGRAPQFAEQSALYRMAALRFEVEREHGTDAEQQAVSCRAHVAALPRANRKDISAITVYEPAFRAITNVLSLGRLAEVDGATAWHRPAAAVTWYYSAYAALLALFAANGQKVGDNHAAARKSYVSAWQVRMPHPFNMVGVRSSGEKYEVKLPSNVTAVKYDIRNAFVPQQVNAQGILLSYLQGTCDWYAERTKSNLLRQHNQFTDFRKSKAKELRDAALEERIGFMHCAYRYRGKANYRDGVFLTYSQRELTVAPTFLESLAVTARFLALFALVMIESFRGAAELRTFLADVDQNLRGVGRLANRDAFWRHVLA